MKKFTKLLLSCALVSVVAAASASMALADDPASYNVTGDLTGVYTVSSNDITDLAITGVTPDADSQVTFLVYKEGADATTVAADDVIGIDQGTTVQPTNKGLKASSVTVPESGQNTYVVKVGYYANNEFKVATGKFVTGTAAGVDRMIGDCNNDGKLATADGTAILRVMNKMSSTTEAGVEVKLAEALGDKAAGADIILGDCNLDGKLATADATAVLRVMNKMSSTTQAGKTASVVFSAAAAE